MFMFAWGAGQIDPDSTAGHAIFQDFTRSNGPLWALGALRPRFYRQVRCGYLHPFVSIDLRRAGTKIGSGGLPTLGRPPTLPFQIRCLLPNSIASTVDGQNPAPPGMYEPYKQWENHHPWWCRILSINSMMIEYQWSIFTLRMPYSGTLRSF